MNRIRLGRTGLWVSRSGFGAIPIQRLSFDESAVLLRKAYDGGINFFDTARGYSDSEEKIGRALGDVRDHIVLATKSTARNRKGLLEHLETSLRNLRTDRVDLLQLHNPAELPDPEDPESAYSAAREAQAKGWVRFIGVTNHRLDVARRSVDSGLFDTLQFPLSAVSSAEDLELIERCARRDVGVIAMKALCGGLLTNAVAAFAFLRQYDNVVPIWGIQRISELDEFLSLEAAPPELDAALRDAIESDRAELAGEFCRGCGYCLPCTAEIPIPTAARMSYLLRRTRTEGFLTPKWREQMQRIENCADCGKCKKRCPYHLDIPVLLRRMLQEYREFVAETKA